MARCCRNNRLPIGRHVDTGQNDHAPAWRASKCLKRVFDVIAGAQWDHRHFHACSRRHRLNQSHSVCPKRILRTINGGHPFHTRRHLCEQLQPFSADMDFKTRESGSVASWLGQALYQPNADRIGNVGEYNGKVARRLLETERGLGRSAEKDIRSPFYQIISATLESGRASTGEAVVDSDITSFLPP